jgi:hypothetical protein
LEPFGHKTQGILCVALATALMGAGSLLAQQNSTTSSTQKPAAHSTASRPAGAANHPSTTHPQATKHGTTSHLSTAHSSSARSPQANSTTAHSSTTQAVARKTGPPAPAASAAGKKPVRYVSRTTQHTTQHSTSNAHYRRPVPLNGQQRLARLHLEPDRVDQIQEALIREGYLQGEPTGLWDARTHDAMLRYQTDHGFPATGLPEAKSLMKLGLGSHPLPVELDHGPAGVARVPGAAAETAGAGTAPPSPTSSQIASPPIPK